jgi:hypothetical protein
MAILKTQIQIKRDEYSKLENHVLQAGEPAIAIMSNPGNPEVHGHMQFAVGDGVTPFKDLSLKLKDGVTNVSGLGGLQNVTNAIAVFTNPNDIRPRSVFINENNIITGAKQINISNDANVSPLVINNPVLVRNLNADLLDGKDGSYYFNETWIDSSLENISLGIFPLLINTENSKQPRLYVNVSKAVSDDTITLKNKTGEADIKINSLDADTFTLNGSAKSFEFSVAKVAHGGRGAGAIVSAISQGTIQSNAYELSYTPPAQSGAIMAATMTYDDNIEAIRFIFA